MNFRRSSTENGFDVIRLDSKLIYFFQATVPWRNIHWPVFHFLDVLVIHIIFESPVHCPNIPTKPTWKI